MHNNTNQPISSVDDVLAYLFDELRKMRSEPLEDDFHEGYEQAFREVLCHVLKRSAKPSEPTNNFTNR
jgi:hypothetical protein